MPNKILTERERERERERIMKKTQNRVQRKPRRRGVKQRKHNEEEEVRS